MAKMLSLLHCGPTLWTTIIYVTLSYSSLARAVPRPRIQDNDVETDKGFREAVIAEVGELRSAIVEFISESVAGPNGGRGEAGERGPPGSRGPRGAEGPMGQRGERGPAGRDGLPGSKGRVGQKGDIGLPGPEGECGLTGSKGERGFAGTKGEPGSPGRIGPKGPRGPPGSEANVAALAARVENLEKILQSRSSADKGCTWQDVVSALEAGKHTWVHSGLDRPGVPVYPCRVYTSGRLTPGESATYGERTYCYVATNGTELVYSSNFDVLVKEAGASIAWKDGTASFSTAVVADSDTRNPFYVARCSHSNATVLGYASSLDTSVMKYGYGETENSCTPFRILQCST